MSVHLANQSSSNCFTAIYRQIIGFRAGTTQVDDFPFNKQTKLQVEKKRQSCACSPSYWQSTAHKGSTKLARFSRTNSCLPLREHCRGKTQNSNTNAAAAAGTGGAVQQKTFFIIIFPQSRQKPGPKRVVYPPRWLCRAPGIEKKVYCCNRSA